MRRVTAIVGALLASAGCTSILGLDFSEYRQGSRGDGSAAQALVCVPGEISRCLCELGEGTQTCDEAGRPSSCNCAVDDSGTEPDVVVPVEASDSGGAQCGNGALDPGESCDDGNAQSGDGCSLACQPDGRPATVEACPGQSAVVWPDGAARIVSSGFSRAAPVDAGSCGSSPKPDRVYRLTSTSTGTLEIKVTASAPVLVSLRSVCATPATQLSCDKAAANVAVTRKIDVVAGQILYLVVEPRAVAPTGALTVDVRKL